MLLMVISGPAIYRWRRPLQWSTSSVAEASTACGCAQIRTARTSWSTSAGTTRGGSARGPAETGEWSRLSGAPVASGTRTAPPRSDAGEAVGAEASSPVLHAANPASPAPFPREQKCPPGILALPALLSSGSANYFRLFVAAFGGVGTTNLRARQVRSPRGPPVRTPERSLKPPADPAQRMNRTPPRRL
jgi:hypothetical protein